MTIKRSIKITATIIMKLPPFIGPCLSVSVRDAVYSSRCPVGPPTAYRLERLSEVIGVEDPSGRRVFPHVR